MPRRGLWIPAPARITAAGRTRPRAGRPPAGKTLTAGIPENGEDDRERLSGRPGERWPGSTPAPAAQIAMVARGFAANDTTLRFSQCDIGERPPPRTSRSQEPRQDIRVRRRAAGHWSGVTPGAARTCRKGEFPSAGSGSFLPCSGEIIRGASGLEFLFINARFGSIGKVLNIASCDNAHDSFDVRSLIKKAGKRLAAVAFRGDHAISAVVPAR